MASLKPTILVILKVISEKSFSIMTLLTRLKLAILLQEVLVMYILELLTQF